MLLTRIEEVPQNPAVSEDKYNRDKKNYIAEARFLRAYFYWELFLRYGPIPIVKEVLAEPIEPLFHFLKGFLLDSHYFHI